MLCQNFGEVNQLRLDTDGQGETFALVEFQEKGPAHVCKTQHKYRVDGRFLLFTESKTMVDAESLAEKTVQFQAPLLDAHNMRQVLTQQIVLSDKLAKVRAAAEELMKPEEATSGGPGKEGAAGQPKEKKKKKEK